MGRRFSSWKWVLLLIVGVGVGAAAFAATRGNKQADKTAEDAHGQAAEDSAGSVRVEVVQPSKGGIARQTIQPGSVIAFESADLFAKLSGFLKMQNVDIGSPVKKGDILAEIDAPEFSKAVEQGRAAVDQAVAEVEQAKARIATAEAQRDAASAAVAQAEAEIDRAAAVRAFREKQYARIKSLYDLKSIDARLVDEKFDEMEAARATEAAAKAAVVTAKSKVVAAQAQVEQSQADLAEARSKVEVQQASLGKAKVFESYTKIDSPYDGVVTKRNFFRGAFIRSPDQGGLVPLLGVSRTDLMRVVVQVPDRDVPFLHVGDAAKVQIDALPASDFSGTVSRMADAEDPQTRTMRIEVDLPNPDLKLREGMYGRVTIQLGKLADALTIPSSCLASTVDNGQADIWVVSGGVAEQRKVRIGADNGLQMEILEGLTTADRVIRRHSGPLADGEHVQVVADEERPLAQQDGKH